MFSRRPNPQPERLTERPDPQVEAMQASPEQDMFAAPAPFMVGVGNFGYFAGLQSYIGNQALAQLMALDDAELVALAEGGVTTLDAVEPRPEAVEAPAEQAPQSEIEPEAPPEAAYPTETAPEAERAPQEFPTEEAVNAALDPAAADLEVAEAPQAEVPPEHEAPAVDLDETLVEAVDAALETELLPETPEPQEAAPIAPTAELRQWRAGMLQATQGLPEPDIGNAALRAGPIRGHGRASAQAREGERQGVTQRAQAAIPETPETPETLPEVVDNPVPEANVLVESTTGRRLTDQEFPALERSPRGTMPNPDPRPPVTPAPQEAQPAGQEAVPTGEQTSGQQEQVAAIAQVQQQPVAEQQGEGEAVTLADTPPPEPQPLNPMQQSIVQQVVVGLLTNVEQQAEGVLTDARRTAYPNQILAGVYPDIGTDFQNDLTGSLNEELRTVAEAAGLAGAELDTAVENRRAALAGQQQQTRAEGEQAAEEARADIETSGQESMDAIAGARDAADASVETQMEAASGESNPEVINAKRERLKRALNRRAAEIRQEYEQAGRRRNALIDRESQRQTRAYRNAFTEDERTIIAGTQADDVAAQQHARLQAADIRNWSDRKQREVQREAYRLRSQAEGWVAGFKASVWTAAQSGQEMIDRWADERTGEERSWWEELMRRFRNWFGVAQQEEELWEVGETTATRNAILVDTGTLSQFVSQHGEQANLDAEGILDGLTEEQQAVIRAYYGQPADRRSPLAAVAVGLRTRLSAQRRPQIHRRFQNLLVDKPEGDYENLNQIGHAENSSFNAQTIADNLYRAMHGGLTGWGTDEQGIFNALVGLTPVQAAAVRKTYSAEHDRNLDEDLEDELSGAEHTRAQALLEGDQALAAAATLHEAMHGGITGLGTDEDTIMATLRGKSEAERRRIIEVYRERYGVDLEAELDSEMDDHEQAQSEALLEGDTARADAIAIDYAMRGGWTGWGTDEADIETVYTRIREEVTATARTQDPPWTSAQVEAEILRRNGAVEAAYNSRYGRDWPGGESALRQAYRDELAEGPELDLVTALADNDMIQADAARLALEDRAIFVSDDETINGVLRHQYERALSEVRLDRAQEMQEDIARMAREHRWDEYQRRNYEREWERRLEAEARRRAQGYMGQLEERFNSDYSRWGDAGLDVLIAVSMSGDEQDRARDLVAQGGYLTPAQEIHYAVEGVGTDEDAIKRALAGRSPDEIREIRREWSRLHPDEALDDRLESELSGRAAFDTSIQMMGEPQDADQELQQMELRFDYEMENSSTTIAGHERNLLQGRMNRLREAYDAYNDPTLSTEERNRAVSFLRLRSGGVTSAIEIYRAQVDAVSDTLATIAEVAIAVTAVAVGIIATIVTGGAAGPGVLAGFAAWLGTAAGVAAVAATAAAAGIGIRYAMRGDAYGWEDIAHAATVGMIDAAASYATLGMSKALIKGSQLLARMAAGGLRARVTATFLSEGVEGAVGAFPSAFGGAALDDETWKSPNPFLTLATATSMGTGMGFAMSGGLGSMMSAAELRAARRAAQAETPQIDAPDGATPRIGAPEADTPPATLADALEGGTPSRADAAAAEVEAPPARADPPDVEAAPTRAETPDAEAPQTELAVLRGGNSPEPTPSRPLTPEELELQATLNNAMPADLQTRVPLVLDPDLPGNTVRVHYDLDASGFVTNIRVRAGVGASALDIELHANTVRAMQRYGGLRGRAYDLLRRFTNMFRRYGEPAIGSLAWEARLEVRKLSDIVDDHMNRLARLDPGSIEAAALRDRIGDLEAQLATHSTIADAMVDDPGVGYVAAEGRNYQEAVRRGLPEISDSYDFISRPQSPTGFYVRRRPEAVLRSEPKLELFVDPDTGRWSLREALEQNTWADRKAESGEAYDSMRTSKDPAVRESVSRFETGARQAGFDPATLDPSDMGLMYGYWNVIDKLQGALSQARRQAMLQDVIGNVEFPLTSNKYSDFRRRLRQQIIDHVTTTQTTRTQQVELKRFLDMEGIEPGFKGELFQMYQRHRAQQAGSGMSLIDVEPTTGQRGKIVLPEVRTEGGSRFREPDGAVNITSPSGMTGAPPKGNHLVENKAGPGAFKIEQARDYHRLFSEAPETNLRLTSGGRERDFKGLIYIFDSPESARSAARALSRESPSLLGPPIYVLFLDTDGSIRPINPARVR